MRKNLRDVLYVCWWCELWFSMKGQVGSRNPCHPAAVKVQKPRGPVLPEWHVKAQCPHVRTKRLLEASHAVKLCWDVQCEFTT